MSEADKIIENLKKSGRKVEEFYTGNKTSDKNVANIEIIKNFIFELKSFGLNKDTLEVANELENLLSDYTRQKQINEEHQRINGELRERVKELEIKLKCAKDLYDDCCKCLLDSIPKQVVIDLIENETIDISGFECIAVEDLQELLGGGNK